MPNSLVRMEDAGLTSMFGLKSLVFPASIERLGQYIDYFSNCTEITFEKNSKLISVGNFFLRNCLKLERITLPPLLSSIGNTHLFRQDSMLKTIVYFGRANFDHLSELFEVTNCTVYVSTYYKGPTFAKIPVKRIYFPVFLYCTNNVVAHIYLPKIFVFAAILIDDC